MNIGNPIHTIVGLRVNGIAFIEDYVEICIGASILRSLARPYVMIHGKTSRYPDKETILLLHSLIGCTIQHVDFTDKEKLQLTVQNGIAVTIPLGYEGPDTPFETMQFVDYLGGPVTAWDIGVATGDK